MHHVSVTAVIVMFVATLFYLPAQTSAQTNGDVRGSFVMGGDGEFQFVGASAGAGVLFGQRAGFEGDFGFLGDDSDEGTLAPLIAVGANVRLTSPARFVPLLVGGFSRIGDVGYFYAGGGALFALSGRTALRLDLRGKKPFTEFGSCVPNDRTSCDGNGGTAVFFHAGLSFGF